MQRGVASGLDAMPIGSVVNRARSSEIASSPIRVLGRFVGFVTGHPNGCGPTIQVLSSCGALVRGGTLELPHGIGDAAIGVATTLLGELLAALDA